MKKGLFRQLVVLLAVAATITINALADILHINGLGTGQISNQFKVFFVPAGYVFSIWGIIYLGFIAYAIFQLLPSQRENPRLKAIAGLFVLSCLANCAWIFLWHYLLFGWTLVAMFVLLVSLILIYLRLGIGNRSTSRAETWMVRVPFSVYLGWVSVATIANVTSVLDFVHWSGWGIQPQVWAAIMLAVGVLLAGLMAFTRRDVAFLLVLVWAFSGIAVKFPTTPVVYYAAWFAAGIAALLIVVTFFLRHQRKQAVS